MGIFKSTCSRVRRKKDVGDGEPIGRHLAELRDELVRYLAEPACAPGMDDVEVPPSPRLDVLARSYRGALTRLEGSRALGDVGVDVAIEAASVAAVALSEVFGVAAEQVAAAVASQTGDSAESLVLSYADGVGDEASSDIDELAKLLNAAYVKALAELDASARAGDRRATIHHLGLVIEQAHAMIELGALATPDWYADDAAGALDELATAG